MCRLLAWHSPTPVTAERVIAPDSSRLAELSRVHCDGWGFAGLSETGAIEWEMGSEPAHESPLFAKVAGTTRTASGIVHLRWATGDLAVSLGNTHPFTSASAPGEVAFVHNGLLPDADELLGDIDPDLVAAFRGETDSERYFGLFATNLRHASGDVVTALRRTADRLQDHAYTSLNAMILTPDQLAVVCLFKEENRPLDEEEDYFDLTWGESDGITSAWSTGVRSAEESHRPLENGTVLLINTRSGAHDVVSIG